MSDERNNHRHGNWTGLFKLIEECGECQQTAGKIAAFPDTDEHPDGCGSLRQRLQNELADVIAAAQHVAMANDLDMIAIMDRRDRKLELFAKWMTI